MAHKVTNKNKFLSRKSSVIFTLTHASSSLAEIKLSKLCKSDVAT
jgi:hypothetical protein